MFSLDEINAEISRIANCQCEGYLKNGRYYFRARRYFAIIPKSEFLSWYTQSSPVAMPNPERISITVDFDTDFHFTQDNISDVASALTAEFDKRYQKELERIAGG